MTDVYWIEQSQTDVPPGDGWLSPKEMVRLGALRFSKRRADWRLGRWTAKRTVATYLNVPCNSRSLARIEIRAAPSGAPEAFLEDQPTPAVISLSHRDGTAICALAPSSVAVGCDLEVIEPRSPAFLSDYFTSEEQALVAQTSAMERPLLITVLWSGKESALKALRVGLRADTRTVTVDPGNASFLRRGEWNEEQGLGLTLPDPEPYGADTWHPLRVHETGGKCFNGWWRHTGNLLRTAVAFPAPHTPILLTPDVCQMSSLCEN